MDFFDPVLSKRKIDIEFRMLESELRLIKFHQVGHDGTADLGIFCQRSTLGRCCGGSGGNDG